MAAVKMTAEVKRFLREPLGVLGLSVRTTNTLEEAGLQTVGELLNCCRLSQEQCRQRCRCRASGRLPATWEPSLYLLDIPNLAAKTIREIDAAVQGKLVELGGLSA